MNEEKTLNSVYNSMLSQMKGELTYTEIPEDTKKELANKCKPKKQLILDDCAKDPTLFAYHIIGFCPYTYQYILFENIRLRQKRLFMVSGRQLGKTAALALIALWAAFYNVFPSGLYKDTKIIIVSKSDDQAKKIISEIKRFIDLGDRTFSKRTGTASNYLSSQLADNQPQTTAQISFKNGSTIKSLAPTESARGYTCDLLILDEAAYIDENLFYDVLEPTTSHTKGIILMTSTPNGMQGLCYKLFDPENKTNTMYTRLWIPWWYCEDEGQRELIEQKKEQWIAEGKIKNFQQEYEAKFTASETSFFDVDKINKSVDDSLAHVMDWHTEPCSLGIDYGYKSSRTTLTIVSKGKDNIIRERFQHVYLEDGSDINVDVDVDSLMKRFNIINISPDDCPAGFTTNQKLIQKGYPVKLFNFRSDQNAGERNRGYYMLRAGIYQGKVKITKNVEMMQEMKGLLEIKNAITITIKSESCDRIDGLCMACYPFLAEGNDTSFGVINDSDMPFAVEPSAFDPRRDKEWDRLRGKE